VADILVVDDDPAVSTTLVRMLTADGHAARAADARRGLELAATEPPDAVILDLRMPATDGVAFVRALRASTSLAHLPVAVITGDYFLKDAVLRELHDLSAVVRYKPLSMEDLSSLTHELLGQRVDATPGE
jgi:DNA-binding response OmpR family regulator